MVRNFYFLGILVAAVLGWSSWMLVLYKMSPFISGVLALTLFYASLMLALTSTFSLLVIVVRLWLGPAEFLPPLFGTTLREGFLLSLMITVGLLFQRLRVLTWWDALLLLAIVLLLEFFFLARD